MADDIMIGLVSFSEKNEFDYDKSSGKDDPKVVGVRSSYKAEFGTTPISNEEIIDFVRQVIDPSCAMTGTSRIEELTLVAYMSLRALNREIEQARLAKWRIH